MLQGLHRVEPVLLRTFFDLGKGSFMDRKMPEENKAGGDVHMQPLMAVDRTLRDVGTTTSFLVSLTGKTGGTRYCNLSITAESALGFFSMSFQQYLFIRSFASNQQVRKKVQHGDVVVVTWSAVAPLFLLAKIDCAEMSQNDCFERPKVFCYLAKSQFEFIAIVENDRDGGDA